MSELRETNTKKDRNQQHKSSTSGLAVADVQAESQFVVLHNFCKQKVGMLLELSTEDRRCCQDADLLVKFPRIQHTYVYDDLKWENLFFPQICMPLNAMIYIAAN